MAETARARRIIYLVPDLGDVCVRHRVDVFIPTLEKRGWYVEKWVIPDGLPGRIKQFMGLRGADVVVVLRKLLRGGQAKMLRWCSKKLVFDYDDAVLYRDSNRAELESRGRAWRFRRMIRAADKVIAGNEYLASLAESFGGRATVIPTCIDDTQMSPRGARGGRTDGRVVIGWIGSHSTVMYLEGLREVFGDIARRYRSAVLKVVSDRFPGAMGIETVEKRWSLADEAEDLRSFDIGVMPLSDDVWTRGKCGFKLLQYMAVGAAVVASPVGVNSKIVRDGENGLAAKNREEWVAARGRLIEDAEYRRKLGEAGRRSLTGRYAVSDWAGRYADLMDEAAGR
jgi:hypothetical protein